MASMLGRPLRLVLIHGSCLARNYSFEDLALIQCRSFGSSLVEINECIGIEADESEYRGVKIMNMESIFDCMESEVIGLAYYLASSDVTSREPHREAIRVVIAAVPLLGHRSPTKLAPPDNERLLQEPSAFQVGEEARNWLVHRRAVLSVIFLDPGMGIPLAAGTVIKLNEPNSALHESTSQQTVAAEGRGLLAINPVEPLSLGRLGTQINRFWSFSLHPEREFIG